MTDPYEQYSKDRHDRIDALREARRKEMRREEWFFTLFAFLMTLFACAGTFLVMAAAFWLLEK